jgi:CspA family cold shock protein
MLHLEVVSDVWLCKTSVKKQFRTKWRPYMATGTVKWFNDSKGFGFIVQDGGGPDVFVHHTAIIMQGHRTLAENQKVEFDIQQGPKGPQAANVRGA